MNTRVSKSILFIVLSLFVLSPFSATAQFTTDPNDLFVDDPSAESVEVTVTPENPQPGQLIQFKVVSYLSDLERSTITWSVNGKKEASGTGLVTFSTVMGTIGNTTRVNLNILTNKGITITKAFTFTAAQVELVWEAESYTPPFYKGKALMGRYQPVKIIALPQLGKSSVSLSSTDLIYTWKKNGRVLGSLSGYGKNTLLIDRTETGKEMRIEVVVSNKEGSVNATNELFLAPSEPKLLAYIYSPANGILFNRALQGQMKMGTKELSIAAVPYYLSAYKESVRYLNYEWKMGNEKSNVIDQIFTVRNKASTAGETTINVSVFNQADNMSEKVATVFSLSF